VRRWVGAALVVGGLGASAGAQPPTPSTAPTPPTATAAADDAVLTELIAQSLAARPELAQARALERAERERAPQVTAHADPMLAVGIQNDGFTSWQVGKMETSFLSIMASQTLPWPGKRALRGEVATLAAKASGQVVARLLLATEAEVRRGYLALMVARERLGLLDELEAVWERSAAVARFRAESGQGAQADVLRAQLELNRMKTRRWALQAEVATAIAGLNRLRGHRLDELITPPRRLAELALPVAPVTGADGPALADAVARSPELAVAALATTSAAQATALAGKATLPDLTVSVGLMVRGTDLPPMWLATIGGPLPIFGEGRKAHAVAEGEARQAAAAAGAQAVRELIGLRVVQRRTALAATLATIGLYQGGLLIQSAATADSTLSQYQVGKLGFASVLEANAGLIADREGYLYALAQAHGLAIDAAEVNLGPSAPGAGGAPASGGPAMGGGGGEAGGGGVGGM
jgi:outer membrane protein TolC